MPNDFVPAENFLENLLTRSGAAATALLKAGRRQKRAVVMLADAVCCALAGWLAFALRLGDVPRLEAPFFGFVGFTVLLVLLVFYLRGIYEQVFRFLGPRGLAELAVSCLVIGGLTIVVFGLAGFPGVPRTVSGIFPVLLLMLVTTNRVLAKFLLVDLHDLAGERTEVLIYGAGPAARQLAASLGRDRQYRLAAYVSSDPAILGQSIDGARVIAPGQTRAWLEDHSVGLVLLADPDLGRKQRQDLVAELQAFRVDVRTLPSVSDLITGEVSFSDLRPVDIGDLLMRSPVAPDRRLLGQAITGKDVFVTGAGGSIGSELCRQILAQRPRRLVLFEMTEAALFAIDGELRRMQDQLSPGTEIIAELGTLENPRTVERLFARWRPHTVYHAAAYKHVPMVESNMVAGISNNVFGTLNAALAARANAVERFVLVSTDKAVRPTNVMGASKRICELVLQALAAERDNRTVFTMVRFGNVLGSSGSVVPHFQAQIAAGGPVTVTHREVTRFFMTIEEAASLVIQAGAMARGGEVYLLDMGDPVKIVELAEMLVSLSGLTLRSADNPDGDIEIREIGLRPGEKLYEELLIDAQSSPTDHPKIFAAREDFVAWGALSGDLEAMRTAAEAGDRERLRPVLARLVAGYGDAASASAGDNVARPASWVRDVPHARKA